MGSPEHNYKKDPPEKPYIQKATYSEMFLREEYLEKQHSITHISKLCMSSRDTIKRALKKHNIELRPDDVMTSGPVRFGKKRIKGKEIDHKREQEVKTLISELRDQKFSYQKIANILNTMGIKSKKKGKWYAKTIRTIFLNSKKNINQKS